MPYSENNRVRIDLGICCQVGACAAACPLEAITMADGFPHLIKNCADPCQDCCDICPSDAISMKD
jgi:Fe-S-cluster-containing hydrogenase component 2